MLHKKSGTNLSSKAWVYPPKSLKYLLICCPQGLTWYCLYSSRFGQRSSRLERRKTPSNYNTMIKPSFFVWKTVHCAKNWCVLTDMRKRNEKLLIQRLCAISIHGFTASLCICSAIKHINKLIVWLGAKSRKSIPLIPWHQKRLYNRDL